MALEREFISERIRRCLQRDKQANQNRPSTPRIGDSPELAPVGLQSNVFPPDPSPQYSLNMMEKDF
jgi:hypothetical protein